VQALLLLREGQAQHCPVQLGDAQRHLDSLGMARDALYASLSLADLSLADLSLSERGLAEQGQDLEGSLDSLNLSADRLYALGGSVSLESELRGLPAVRRALEALPEHHYAAVLRPMTLPSPSPRLELRVLGHAGTMLLGGRALRVHYAQAPLILYYLLRYPGKTVQQLVADLFPDRPYRPASQYFYKVRLALNAAIPGLDIQNHPGTGCRVQLEGLSLAVDAFELEAMLERGEVEAALERYAALLPQAQGEWIEEEREGLMKFMTRVAVKSINDNYEAGNFERCVKIASHILTCDPFDPVLNDLYLRALRELHGPLVAQQTAHRVRQRFVQENLEPPYELEAFFRQNLN